MKRKILSLLLTAALTLAMTVSAFAATSSNPGPVTAGPGLTSVIFSDKASPEPTTTMDMARYIIEFETDPDMKTMFLDYAKAYTEDTQDYKGWALAGKYPRTVGLAKANLTLSITFGNGMTAHTNNSQQIISLIEKQPESERIQTREEIKMLYEICKKARTDTANMTEHEKADYAFHVV